MNHTALVTTPLAVVSGATDPGKSGKHNEDHWQHFSIEVPDGAASETMLKAELIVIADGIGGTSSGEVASHMAVDVIGAAMNRERTGRRTVLQRLEGAVTLANAEIFQRSASDAESRGMGTTVLALVITENLRCYAAHAGDSRAYLIRGNRIYLLTLDHTRVQEMVEMGRISQDEARVHPNRHVVSRFVGIEEKIAVDLKLVVPNDQPKATPDFDQTVQLQPGDTLLCCSDGLNDMLSDSDIFDIVRRHGAQNAATELVKAANARGGFDNITAVVATLPGGAPPRAFPARTPGAVTIPIPALLMGLLLLLGIGAAAVFGPALLGATGTEELGTVAAASGGDTPVQSTVPGSPTATQPLTDDTGQPIMAGTASAPEATVVPGSTRVTSTPIIQTSPSPTATWTPVPVSTVNPVLTTSPVATTRPGVTPPQPSATSVTEATTVASVTESPVATPALLPIQLERPAHGAVFGANELITFEWSGARVPQGNEYFDVRIWRRNAPPPHYGVVESKGFWASINTNALGGGEWCWSVALVDDGGTTTLVNEAPQHCFIVAIPETESTATPKPV